MAKNPPDTSPATTEDVEARTGGKGRPTPTRAEREAARKRPLVPDGRAAKKQARAELSAQRERARVGMANGDERYLPERDRGPQRRYVRDWVDSRWHVAEWIMPVMVVVLLLMFVGIADIQMYSYLLLWVFVIAAILDMVITSIRVKRAARARFGANRMEKGLGWYAAMRMMQMRFLRIPKPQVARGQRPE